MCRTNDQCDTGQRGHMDEQQHGHRDDHQWWRGDGSQRGGGYFDLYQDLGRMFEQHEFYGICEPDGTGSGHDHAADMSGSDGECCIERIAGFGKLDPDAFSGGYDLHGERHELYGDGITCGDDVHLYGYQQ